MTNIKSNIIKSIKTFFIEKWRLLLFAFIVLFSIMFFIFGLGYSTNVAKAENTGFKEITALVKEVQTANNELVIIGIIAIVFMFINIMIGSHNRKKYFISNYIFMGGLLATLAFGAIRMIQHSAYLVEKFAQSFASEELGYVWTELYIAMFRKDIGLNDMLNWFELGYIVSIITIIACILIGVLIYVAVIQLPKIKEREAYVKHRLQLVDSGEIKVNEKVVNMVPTLDVELDLFDDEEKELKPYNKTEKMRYLKNSLGYALALLGLVLFLYALFMTITYDTYTSANDRPRVVPTIGVALDIVLSILITLIMFLSAEKVKIYEKKWEVVLLVIATVNTLRIFTIPLQSLNNGSLPLNFFLLNILVPMIASIVLTVAAAVISYKKSTSLNHFLKEIGEK